MSYIYIWLLHFLLYYYLHYAFFFLILVVSKIHMLFGLKMNKGDVCLADCATTHTILWDKRYFLELTLIKVNVSIIFGTTNLVEGFEKTNIMLLNGTRFHINDVLYSSKSKRNLFGFKDIHINEYHIETMNEGNVEYLYTTSIIYDQMLIVEKVSIFSSEFYHTNIKRTESYVLMD